MKQFFLAFLSFEQILDPATTLDGKPMKLKVFQSSLGFIYFLSKISFIEFSFPFPVKILNLILNFFEIFFINERLSFFKL